MIAYQVGNWTQESTYWGRPEDLTAQNDPRPAYNVSMLAGEWDAGACCLQRGLADLQPSACWRERAGLTCCVCLPEGCETQHGPAAWHRLQRVHSARTAAPDVFHRQLASEIYNMSMADLQLSTGGCHASSQQAVQLCQIAIADVCMSALQVLQTSVA